MGWRSQSVAKDAPKRGNNLGTEPPEYPLKSAITAEQKARRVNNLAPSGQSAKPPPPVQIRAAPPILVWGLRPQTPDAVARGDPFHPRSAPASSLAGLRSLGDT